MKHRLHKSNERPSPRRHREAVAAVDESNSYTVNVRAGGLNRINVRPSFTEYVSQLLLRRQYIWAEAAMGSLRVDRDYRLGRLWLVVQPLFDAALYIVMFGFILKTNRGVDNYIGYVALGMIFFGFISRLMTMGAGLLKTQKNTILSFKFPRASLPLARSINQVIENGPAAVVAIAIALLAQIHTPISPTILLVPLLYFLIMLFASGLMLITARLTAFLPDFKPVIALFTRFWMFGSGVFYSISTFVSHETLRSIMENNPAAIFLDAVRDTVMYGQVPTAVAWVQMLGWSFGVFFLGLFYFWQAEERYVRALQ